MDPILHAQRDMEQPTAQFRSISLKPLNVDVQALEGLTDGEHHARPVLRGERNFRIEFRLPLLAPTHVHPACGMQGRGIELWTIGVMDGHATTPGHVAQHFIAPDGLATLGQVVEHADGVIHQDFFHAHLRWLWRSHALGRRQKRLQQAMGRESAKSYRCI